MAYRIAMCGKGGTGKTTVSALTVARLVARGKRPVLAVDADPNACLDAALGVRATATVGGVREEARRIAGQGLAVGVDKQHLLEMKISESLVEGTDFDLIAMGRSEGPGCYCYANNVLKAVIAQLSGAYPWIVIDNEAGLENLSRRIAPEVDALVMVSDGSMRGLDTARRLFSLAHEMDIRYSHSALVVNRCRAGVVPPYAVETARAIGAETVVAIPEDTVVAQAAEAGTDVFCLAPVNPVVRAVDELVERLTG